VKLEVVGRHDMRWRLRVDVPGDIRVSSALVGLVGEDGHPLGPAVVAGPVERGSFTVDVRGPCALPPGAVARVTLDVAGEEPITHDLLLAERRGLHAWLRADARLPVESRAEFADLSRTERRRLAAVWCWLEEQEASGAVPTAPACGADAVAPGGDAEPAVTEAAPAEPAPTEPAPTEPAPTEAGVTAPAEPEPGLTGPTVTGPAVTEPAPSSPSRAARAAPPPPACALDEMMNLLKDFGVDVDDISEEFTSQFRGR
jgi:hypothetical protein